jgi:hypothetical protein
MIGVPAGEHCNPKRRRLATPPPARFSSPRHGDSWEHLGEDGVAGPAAASERAALEVAVGFREPEQVQRVVHRGAVREHVQDKLFWRVLVGGRGEHHAVRA